MRILFSSLSSHGHLYPLIPLARAARDLGHDVLYATGEEFHPTLKPLGLRTVAAGMSMREAFAVTYGGENRPQDLPEEQIKTLIPKVFGHMLPHRFATDLQPVMAEFAPDLVVHEAGNHGAGLAARRAGTPGLCHGFGRVSFGAIEGFEKALRECADELGIELPAGNLASLGNPYLDICPLSLQEPEIAKFVERIPLRPVPFNEPGELPSIALRSERPRPLVYLTLGTAFGTPEVLRQAIDGLSTLDVDVLVAAGPAVDADALGDVPDNVMVRKWLPQADLLPHVDLILHHGGSGTTLASLGAGLPQLFLPQGADQFANAEAVTAAGAGLQLPTGITVEAISTTAKTLLTEEHYHGIAQDIAAEIAAMPAPAEFAARLPEFAA